MLKKVKFDSEVTLGQFLKAEGIIGTGGQAKWFLQETDVELNGESESRRGKKLAEGDVLDIAGEGRFQITYENE